MCMVWFYAVKDVLRLQRPGLLLIWFAGILLTLGTGARAQSVTFLGAPVDFGNVHVCPLGGSSPAPCESNLTFSYRVTAGGSLEKPAVLTQGAPYQDFKLASSTCTGSVSTGSTCKVVVTFGPKYPGPRAGAVQILSASGKVLATTFIRGMGLAPQATFNGAQPVPLVTADANIYWSGIAVDGWGNLFYANGARPGQSLEPAVFELPAGEHTPKTVGAGFSSPVGIAVDGAGNLYVGDVGLDLVIEVPSGCTSTTCQIDLDGDFTSPNGVAVDTAGNVFVADSASKRVLKMPAGCTKKSCAVSIGSGWDYPYGIALDAAGDVFVYDLGHARIDEVPAAGGA